MEGSSVISRSFPLCVLDDSAHVHPRIEIFLDEPLLQKMDVKKLAAYCAFANILIQMDQHKCKVEKNFNGKTFEELQTMCYEIAPKRPYMSVLRELGILDCFPHLKRFLETIKAFGTWNSVKKLDKRGQDYLAYVASLNQLLAMSRQIRDDINQPHNHKYMAHQVALLYQCINQVKGELKPLKKRIEERFNGLKLLVENSSSTARLNELYSNWLRDLTDDVRTIVASLPGESCHSAQPVAKMLECHQFS